jgi:hypothetical protein
MEVKCYGRALNSRQPRIPMTDEFETALAEIGGQPLTVSGFEDETS